MHKIQRNEPPNGLNEKNIEFNQKDNHTSEEIKNEWNAFTKSVLKKKTLENLKEMFKNCCAYCEGKYVVTSSSQIEHFKPKSLYPNLMFDYNNMNLSCELCNKAKLNKFDEKLINPTVDEPYEHIQFKAYMIVPKDERGKTTIDMFKLNSNERVNIKKAKYIPIYNRLEIIKEEVDNIKLEKEKVNEWFIKLLTQTVEEMEETFEDGFEYTSMYRHNFKDIAQEMKLYLNNYYKSKNAR